jgi:hypothetical protein
MHLYDKKGDLEAIIDFADPKPNVSFNPVSWIIFLKWKIRQMKDFLP